MVAIFRPTSHTDVIVRQKEKRLNSFSFQETSVARLTRWALFHENRFVLFYLRQFSEISPYFQHCSVSIFIFYCLFVVKN